MLSLASRFYGVPKPAGKLVIPLSIFAASFVLLYELSIFGIVHSIRIYLPLLAIVSIPALIYLRIKLINISDSGSFEALFAILAIALVITAVVANGRIS